MSKIEIVGGPGCIWMIFANLCFLMSAMFAHVLPIRFFLTNGFVWLLVYAATGFPHWPHLYTEPIGQIQLAAVLSALVCLIFHVYAFQRHLRDELPVGPFPMADDEAVWRYFFRRCGMKRLEFKKLVATREFVHVRKGEDITDLRAVSGNLIVSGIIKLTMRGGYVKHLRSGNIFDLGLFSVFGVRLGFEYEILEIMAETDCTLCTWSVESLDWMAHRTTIPVSIAWRNLLLYNVSEQYHCTVMEPGVFRDAYGEFENVDYLSGARSRDFSEFYKPSEMKAAKWSMKRFVNFVISTWNPIAQEGISHLHPMASNIESTWEFVRSYAQKYPQSAVSEPEPIGSIAETANPANPSASRSLPRDTLPRDMPRAALPRVPSNSKLGKSGSSGSLFRVGSSGSLLRVGSVGSDSPLPSPSCRMLVDT